MTTTADQIAAMQAARHGIAELIRLGKTGNFFPVQCLLNIMKEER